MPNPPIKRTKPARGAGFVRLFQSVRPLRKPLYLTSEGQRPTQVDREGWLVPIENSRESSAVSSSREAWDGNGVGKAGSGYPDWDPS